MPVLTPVLKLPSPLLTDTPDIPRDIKALADAVETSLLGASGPLNRVKKLLVGQGIWGPPGSPVSVYGTVQINFPVGFFNNAPLVFFEFADNPDEVPVQGTINANLTFDLRIALPYVVNSVTPTKADIGGLRPGSAVRLNYLAIEQR